MSKSDFASRGRYLQVYVRYLFPGIALMLLFAIGLPIWYFYIMYTIRGWLQVSSSCLCRKEVCSTVLKCALCCIAHIKSY